MTETNQDRISAIPTTGNSALQNSDAAPLEKATGMKPAHVMSVPLSIGMAVAR